MHTSAALVALCVLLCAGPSLAARNISVFSHSGQYTWQNGQLPGAAAYGSFDGESVNSTGWAKLNVKVSLANRSGHFAAGAAESLLTCEFIATVAGNNDDIMENPQILNYRQTTEDWSRAQVLKNPSSEYWGVVGDLLAQFDGLVWGYNQSRCSASVPLSAAQIWLMQMDGDLEDLKQKFPSLETNPHQSSRQQTQRPQHCSSLVKLSDDNSDLFFGHATWDIYSNAAPRIFKTYTLPVTRSSQQLMHTVHFSSTGPWLSSVDDFYTVSGSAELTVMETSNTVLNMSLYQRVTPESLLCWMRVIVANRLAKDGQDWARLFELHHSGTYTNQWQIIDLSKFTPHQEPAQGLLTIVEEVPGLVVSRDMSEHLTARKYWPSYNVPYFDEIRALNGDTDKSWSTAPRAKLFNMFQASVDSIQGMQKLMRWNDYLSTPAISGGDPCNAIACRADLRSPGTHPISAFGAIDAKLSSYNSMLRNGTNSMTVFAEAGPTHDTQPVFCWANSSFHDAHYRHPGCFMFGFDTIRPAEPAAQAVH